MQNPTISNPEIKDPSIPDAPIDEPINPDDDDIMLQTDAADDKSMPSQSGGKSDTDDDDSEVGGVGAPKNKINKYGGKPKGDESIANRGVTKPSPDKDKAI